MRLFSVTQQPAGSFLLCKSAISVLLNVDTGLVNKPCMHGRDLLVQTCNFLLGQISRSLPVDKERISLEPCFDLPICVLHVGRTTSRL